MRGLGRPGLAQVAFALLFVAGTARFFTEKRADGTPGARIGSDGRYYWATLTSLVLDRDLDFENQYADPESGNYFRFGRTPTGRFANPFPIGPAIAWMPFFAVAHGVAQIAGVPHADTGNSYVHQLVTLYASFLYAFGAIILAYDLARRRSGAFPALAGAFAAALCGPIFHYAVNQPYYSHAPSAFFAAAVFWLWDRGRDGRSRRGWLGLGAVLGLAMLMRTQNVVLGAPLIAEAVLTAARAAPGQRLRTLGAPALGALAAFVAFLPQMVAWKIIYGTWAAVPQGDSYMRWTESMWSETLFSSRNGLFPYAPLWALAALGLIAAARCERWTAGWMLAIWGLTAYLNGAAADWSGGGAFGGRRFDLLVVPVAFGMAHLVAGLQAFVERRPRFAAGVAATALVAGFATCNLVLTEAYRTEELPRSTSKDTLVMYSAVVARLGRSLWSGGDPMSWPAAWAFSLHTGAPASRYDLVVGTSFLTDSRLEAFRADESRPRDALRFGAAAHARYLVHGFGAPRKDAGVEVCPAVAAEARVIVPLQHPGAVAFTLAGSSRMAGTLHVRWNGDEVAAAPLAVDAPLSVAFLVPAAAIRRGVNLLDLAHEGAADGERVVYEKLAMEER